MGLGLGNFKNPPAGEKTVIIPGAASRTFAVPGLGITPAVFADGPAGLRIQSQRDNEKQSYYCTAFPTATALASSWNSELVGSVGRAMGNEALEYGCDVLLAPGMNIQRNPLCGRNFEYFTEDPLLSGKLAAALVKGIQENGVGACIKHFAANNQETNRHNFDPLEVGTGWHRETGNPVINAVISQRALREIYLRGFEIAVKESHPITLMSSYNRLNGFYTSENKDLLTTILRKEWGFDGIISSDWRAGSDATAQMTSGNDLLMPGCYQRDALLSALKNKTLDIKVIDSNLERILSFVMKTPRFKSYPFSSKPDLSQHTIIARQSAVESMVLLKNSNSTLPMKGVKRVALFGKTSYRFITGGTGSGEVNYSHAVSPREGLIDGGYRVVKPLEEVYEHFIDTVLSNSKQENKKYLVDFHPELALSKEFIARQEGLSDIALITIGRNSGEGWDRKEKDDYVLSEAELSLIRNVSEVYHAAKKRVVVILNIGGVVEVASWRNDPDAIILAWQTGQEGGGALTDILKGDENPSGKLAVTFPFAYSDVPSAKMFPGEPKENPVNAFYNDGIYVGYRYYNSFHIKTGYEFGYGMSYTNFLYSDLKLSDTTFNDSIEV
ncbi:MAG: glycoside hydrolase family 3 C-terminal domain-containing protein, partial [Paludibacter sp.]|nr:glycoside hydrolase family 3 C-terminal domain-containing protein [Paludibacter sp.]